MKIEEGEAYKVLEDKLPVFHKGTVFAVTNVISDIDAQGERSATIRFTFANGPNRGEKCEFDYELLQELKMIRVYDEKYSKEHEDAIKLGKPAHYDTAIDPITFAKANFSQEAVAGFMRISAIKYLQRDKGETLSDLRKARHFIDMLIEMEENQTP